MARSVHKAIHLCRIAKTVICRKRVEHYKRVTIFDVRIRA